MNRKTVFAGLVILFASVLAAVSSAWYFADRYYPGKYPIGKPIMANAGDSTNTVNPVYFLVYNDSAKAYMIRSVVAGSAAHMYLEARGNGRYAEVGSPGWSFRVVNKSGDTTIVQLGVNEFGEIFGAGRRINRTTGKLVNPFEEIFAFMADSIRFRVHGALVTFWDTSGVDFWKRLRIVAGDTTDGTIGVPVVVDTLKRTGQLSSLSTFNLDPRTQYPGDYLVHVYLETNSVDTGIKTVKATVGWVDNEGNAITKDTDVLTLTADAVIERTFFLNHLQGGGTSQLTIATTVVGVSSDAYDMNVVVTRLN